MTTAKIKATKLRKLYETMSLFNTDAQIAICKSFLQRSKDTNAVTLNGDTLAGLFQSAYQENCKLDKVERNFIDEELAKQRTDLDEDHTKGKRVQYLMSEQKEFSVANYSFKFHKHEFPYRRAVSQEKQDEKGWIDYIGVTNDNTPILGEIKYAEQNPFYAFVQLLMYASELFTPQQLERIDEHNAFGEQCDTSKFDLHILTSGFSEGGGKKPLFEKTEELVSAFLQLLSKHHPDLAEMIRSVRCLRGTISEGKLGLETIWCVGRE